MSNTPVYPTLRSARLTSPFGWRTHPETGELAFHHGIDLAPEVPGTTGVPIYATQDGIVRRVDTDNSRGNFIEIEHTSDGYMSHYLHLASFQVSVGQTVTKGQQIAIMGTTGVSTGIHLDFGISITYPPSFGSPGSYIDPLLYLEGALDPTDPEDPDDPTEPGEIEFKRWFISINRYLNHRRRN